MPSRDIAYTTRDNETFTGYLTEPDGDGKVPGILMITAIFGIDDEMQELADAWAADGFVVSVPDIFWRVMPGPTADMEKAFGRYTAFDAAQGFNDVEDLVKNLRANPRCNGKIAVLGFFLGCHKNFKRLRVDRAARLCSIFLTRRVGTQRRAGYQGDAQERPESSGDDNSQTSW